MAAEGGRGVAKGAGRHRRSGRGVTPVNEVNRMKEAQRATLETAGRDARNDVVRAPSYAKPRVLAVVR